MSGFLTALNAIAQGAQGGFNVYALQQKQKQQADEQAQADADRQRQIAQALATNQALHGLVDSGNAQQAEVPAKTLNFGSTALSGLSDAVKNLPFSQTGGAVPDPTVAPMLDQSATDIRKDAGPTPFNPNVQYGTVLAAQNERRKMQDQEGETASRNLATQSDKDWQHQIVQSKLDEENAAKARAAAAAPQARAYLQKQGVDPSQYPEDADALAAAQKLHMDQWNVNHREATPGSLQMFTGTDGQPHTFNNKTGEIGDAAVGKAVGGGMGAASLQQSHAILNSALQTIDQVIGPVGPDGTSSGGELAQQNMHPLLRAIPLVGSEVANAVSPTSAGLRAKIGIIAGAVPQLEARGRVNAKLLDMMKDAIPDPRQPVTAATRSQLEVLRQRFKAMMDDLGNQSPPTGAAAGGDDPFAAWKKTGGP